MPSRDGREVKWQKYQTFAKSRRSSEIHSLRIPFFYQAKCNSILTGLADIPPDAEAYLKEAHRTCQAAFDNCTPDEAAEIFVQGVIIEETIEELVVKMRTWKIENVSSSDEDSSEG